MKVRLHPEARADLREGKTFYRRRSPLAAIAFAQEVDQAIALVAEAPLRYRTGEYGTREYVLPWRFPYTIVYLVGEKVVQVIAVAHHSREPGYWHRRV